MNTNIVDWTELSWDPVSGCIKSPWERVVAVLVDKTIKFKLIKWRCGFDSAVPLFLK